MPRLASSPLERGRPYLHARGQGCPVPRSRLMRGVARQFPFLTGRGLALAQRWAGLLGGRLGLTSPAEGGACFRVEMTAAPEKNSLGAGGVG